MLSFSRSIEIDKITEKALMLSVSGSIEIDRILTAVVCRVCVVKCFAINSAQKVVGSNPIGS